MNRQAIRDFLITVFFLGSAFVIAMFSSVAAEAGEGRTGAIAAALSLVLALIGAIYSIPRLARNVRLEAMRFAVRTTVTVEGLFFVILLTVIAFAAWNTGNNLLYLILSAMVAFLIAGALLARTTLADLAVQVRFPDHIFAGEPAGLSVTLVNHKRLLPSYSVTVESLADAGDGGSRRRHRADEDAPAAPDDLPPGARHAATPRLGLGRMAYFVLVPARASTRQRVEYTFGRRGRYPIAGFRIATKFPAGFFKKWRRIEAEGEILVYPKPRPLDDFYHTLPMLVGQIESHARGTGDDLYAIRQYHPSDHLRHMDWKATAKSSRLMTREFTREDERRLTIVFDTVRPEPPPAAAPARGGRRRAAGQVAESAARPGTSEQAFEERFERAITRAASLANHFILENADVELITPDEKHNVPSGAGHAHLYKLLRSLATLEPTPWPRPEGEGGKGGRGEGEPQAASRNRQVAWRLLDEVPVLADDRRFKVLITSAQKGTIPAHIWRSAHVIFMDDL